MTGSEATRRGFFRLTPAAVLLTSLASARAQSQIKKQAKPAAGKGGLPKNLSLLFMVSIPEAMFVKGATYKSKEGKEHAFGPHLLVPSESTHWIMFSDRPNRIAKTIPGGVKAFTAFYHRSDFKLDHPNVTFAGQHTGTSKENYAVLKMSSPFILHNNAGALAGRCVLPLKPIGSSKLPEPGDYKDVSLVVDSIIGDWLETVAAGIGTAVACTVGEVATAGLDSPACVAAIAGTVASATNASIDSAGGP